jgi:hypothetical protein
VKISTNWPFQAEKRRARSQSPARERARGRSPAARSFSRGRVPRTSSGGRSRSGGGSGGGGGGRNSGYTSRKSSASPTAGRRATTNAGISNRSLQSEVTADLATKTRTDIGVGVGSIRDSGSERSPARVRIGATPPRVHVGAHATASIGVNPTATTSPSGGTSHVLQSPIPTYFRRSADISDIDARLRALQEFLAAAKSDAPHN